MTGQALQTPRNAANKSQGEKPAFMAFVGDDVTRALVSKVALERQWPETCIRNGGFRQAIQELSEMPTPRQLIVDLADETNPLESITSLSEVCDPGTQLIVLGQQNDINLFREIIALGVQDYLLKPVSADSLTEALNKSPDKNHDAETAIQRGGKIICVIGSRGGVGASSVALNAAWMLAHEENQKVALVDLDLYFGSLSLALDLEPGRGFREALLHPERIDGLFIERAMVRQSDRLFVLSAEEELSKTFDIDTESVDQLFEPLRDSFDYIVTEIPRNLAPQFKQLISNAGANVIVTDASLAGMRDTLRLAEFIQGIADPKTLHVVMNRIGLVRKSELSPKDFARETGLTIQSAIPFHPRIAGESMAAGKPMVALGRRSKLASAMRRLIQSIVPTETSVESLSFWRRKKQTKNNKKREG